MGPREIERQYLRWGGSRKKAGDSTVELADADQAAAIAGIRWTERVSARRIPDALIAAAAEHAGCAWIATFDERMASPSVPVRTI